MNRVGSDKRLNYYRLTPEKTIAELRSHGMGLTNTEAERRYQEHGPNELMRLERESSIGTFLWQFQTIFVVILLLGAGCALYLNNDGAAAILTVIALLNTAISFLRAYKAETLFDKLENMVPPRSKVVRNGAVQEIATTHLVIGDIITIEEGDTIPADIRILDEQELTTNDFALTGKNNPTRKFAHPINAAVPLAARQNLACMGTAVATGSAHGIVIATGMHTELGRLASLAQVTKSDRSPLEREMNNLGLWIGWGALALAAILTVVTLQAGLELKAVLLLVISIAAAIVPNGLTAELGLILAQTVGRLTKFNVLVRRLSAVDTLGRADIILTDEIGPLTKHEVNISRILIGRTTYHTTGSLYEPKGSIVTDDGKNLSSNELKHLSLFFVGSALACNARVCPPDARHHSWYVLGDPVEGAIVTIARRAGINTEALNIEYPEVKEFPFDAGRQLMSSVREYDNELVVFVQGTPDAIMGHCKKIWDHAHVRNFTKGDRSFFANYLEQEAEAAQHTIAIAYRILPKQTDRTKLAMYDIEQNLTFLGTISTQHPLRAGIPVAMHTARTAHIPVAIITAGNPVIARAVAVQAQLATTADEITTVTSDDLASLADTQILQLIESGAAIFCYATPEDKLRLAEIAKSGGHTVVVTGDGINDIPALLRADIGVSLGKTGTDAAKTTAELVLLNDNFSALVMAIEQGRVALMNIRKAVTCALTDNAAELIAVLMGLAGAVFFHIPLAITVVQIVAIDIAVQLLPIASLGRDKPGANLMHRHPHRPDDRAINRRTAGELLLIGLLAGTVAYANFLLFFVRTGLSAAYIDPSSSLAMQAATITFLTLAACQFINLLFVRADSHTRFFSSYLWSNTWLLGAGAVSLLLVCAIVYIPQLQQYFGTMPLDLADWLMVIAASGVYFGLRLLQRHTRQHARHAVVKLHHEVYGKGSPAQI